jgi:hypothetical protein
LWDQQIDHETGCAVVTSDDPAVLNFAQLRLAVATSAATNVH